VWDKLTAALRCMPGAVVSGCSQKALRDLRRRIGTAPITALLEVLAGPLATPSTPGVRYRRWRTVAFDGCSSLKAPDANSGWLGKIKHRMGWAGYPMVTLMCLVETGTRGLLAATFGPSGIGESAYARRLVGALNSSMLVLADRGFDANVFFQAVAGTKAQFLVRVKSTRRPPVLAVLPDGSWLTRIAGVNLRVIDAHLRVVGADGSQVTGSYRLMTTLTDHRADPGGHRQAVLTPKPLTTTAATYLRGLAPWPNVPSPSTGREPSAAFDVMVRADLAHTAQVTLPAEAMLAVVEIVSPSTRRIDLDDPAATATSSTPSYDRLWHHGTTTAPSTVSTPLTRRTVRGSPRSGSRCCSHADGIPPGPASW
jgi:hypothetical protein